MQITEISSPRLKRKFVKLPLTIYRNNDNFVFPLLSEVKEKIHPAKNPFFKYGQVKLFGVIDKQNNLLGRIAAILNPNYEIMHGLKAGFFGMLESINNKQVACLLLDAAKSYLKNNGCVSMIGPVNFTTNDESGVLVDGFSLSASFMCAYNQLYYPVLLEQYGLHKAVDMLAFTGQVEHIYPDKFERVISRISANPALYIRTFDKKRRADDTRIICDLYNKSFGDVWGYVPLTQDEAALMSDKFLAFYDPELIWLAFINGTPAGFILALPDINRVLKNLHGRLFPFGILKLLKDNNKIDTIRVLAMGVIPDFRNIGLETLLIHRIHKRMKEKVYKSAELSFVMETNYRMRRVLENLGFQIYKRYRIYEISI